MQAEQSEVDFEYLPQERQSIFLTAPADERFYGGAAGGGKTDSLLADMVTYHLRYPGTVGVFFRRSYPELTDPIMRSHSIIPPSLGKYNQGAHRWTLAGGSRFYFRHMQDDTTPFAHQGASYQYIAFDEMTHFSQFQVAYLRDTRLRSDNPEIPLRFAAASNPGNVGHVHVRENYVEPARADAELLYMYAHNTGRWVKLPDGFVGPPGPFMVWRQPKDKTWHEQNAIHLATGGKGELPRKTRVFVPSLLENNEYYNRDGRYRAGMAMSVLDPIMLDALLRGDWSRFIGQYFPDFKREVHVTEPFTPPLEWPKWGSLDWGFAAPMAIHCHTYDFQRDIIYTYREVYRTAMKDGEVIEAMKGMAEEAALWGFTWYADPSIWTKDSSGGGQSKAEIYAEAGLDVQPGNNNRLAGWGRMQSLIGVNPMTKEPGWKITENCTHLIRTLPKLVRSEKRMEDVDTDGEDHAADSARYGLLSRPQIFVPSGDWKIEAGQYIRR